MLEPIPATDLTYMSLPLPPGNCSEEVRLMALIAQATQSLLPDREPESATARLRVAQWYMAKNGGNRG